METHRPRHGDTGAVVEKETTSQLTAFLELQIMAYFISNIELDPIFIFPSIIPRFLIKMP